jgi:hypothetical protein
VTAWRASTLAAWTRGHREIENRLHWVRDVTYQEDNSLARTGSAPRVMTTLRSLASSLLRLDGHANIAADRHHARPRPPAHPKAASTCMNTTLPGPWQTHELVGAVISEWSRFCSPQMRQREPHHLNLRDLPVICSGAAWCS